MSDLSEQIPLDSTLRKGTCLVCGEDFFDEKICPNDGTPLQQIKEDANLGSILAERFEIISALGKGGMSTVYKGRHMLMDRIVAIKLLTASDVQSLKRFQLEAKLACNLNHRNIVTVFDFGISVLGQPYLVMDYLEGSSLSDIIKAQGPMAAERALSIFIQACDALSYAHKREVVHRDLKPSNFMILQQDDEEILKLVDFGIAKQLNTETPEALSLTQTGEVLGSPLYMSPEQCLGQKLDQRADIYSLGCVMYEVLTGYPPLVGTNALDILHKHINEDPPPFTVINPSVANLPPGLEKVVFRALERNRDRRYQTMLDLWSELEVLKNAAQRQSSPSNRVTKIVDRPEQNTKSVHKLAEEWMRPNPSTNSAAQISPQSIHVDKSDQRVAIAGGAGDASVAGAAGGAGGVAGSDGSASWQIPGLDKDAVPVAPPRSRAAERPRAYVVEGTATPSREVLPNSAESQAVSPASSAPVNLNSEARSSAVKPDAGDRPTSLSASAAAGSQPLPTAAGTGITGSASAKNILIGLGALATVVVLVLGGLQLVDHLVPLVVNPGKRGASLDWETQLKAGEEAYTQAHYDQAADYFQVALKQARSFPENDQRLADTLNNLGNAYFKLDQYPDAEQALNEALKIRSVGDENAAMADSMTDLAMVYCAQGRLDKAQHLLNRGLTIRKRKCGAGSEEVADSLASLAALYNKQGRVGDAMKSLKQCLDIRNSDPNPRPADLAATENSIATCYQMQHKLPQARLWFERAMNHAEAALGPDHPLVSDSLVGLASVDFLQSKYGEAEKLFNRAREIRDQAYGRENLRTAEVLACLAILKEQQGQYAEAKPLLFKALSIKKEVLGDSNPEVMRTAENYNDLLKHLGK